MASVPIDPRIRERRIEVIREAGLRRLRITLVVASAIIAIGLVFLTIHSPLLDLDHVRVTGARRESTSDVQAAARLHLGDPLLFVDTGAVARRVEKLPWVERAVVHREFPGTLTISITDYVPTAYVRRPDGLVVLIAPNGRAVAVAHTTPAVAVEIRGERVAPTVGSLLSPPAAADVMRYLPGRLQALVGAIDVGATFALDLRSGGQVRLGTLDDLRAKGVAALGVLDHLAGQGFAYIDVSAPQAPVSR
ncbi:MAG: cell division protein FtsQ [Actinomycetota bacterium]|nr:cell division protein FtsQ [Actinomycetota bacterium]